MSEYKCEDCHDTGYGGDMGPGIKGNHEYEECHCEKGQALKHDADRRLRAMENACRSLSTAALEAGVVEKMVELCRLRNAIRRINTSIGSFDKRVRAAELLKEIIKLLGSK